MSASQRRKGAFNERKFANWLQAHGWPDARRYLAGDGHQPGDIDAIPGVCLEVRARAECKPGSWLEQAEAEAGTRLPVVVYHPPGTADPGRWVAMVRVEELMRLLGDEEAERIRPEPILRALTAKEARIILDAGGSVWTRVAPQSSTGDN